MKIPTTQRGYRYNLEATKRVLGLILLILEIVLRKLLELNQ